MNLKFCHDHFFFFFQKFLFFQFVSLVLLVILLDCVYGHDVVNTLAFVVWLLYVKSFCNLLQNNKKRKKFELREQSEWAYGLIGSMSIHNSFQYFHFMTFNSHNCNGIFHGLICLIIKLNRIKLNQTIFIFINKWIF